MASRPPEQLRAWESTTYTSSSSDAAIIASWQVLEMPLDRPICSTAKPREVYCAKNSRYSSGGMAEVVGKTPFSS